MNQAAVGFQCPECVREGQRSTRSPRAAYGGRPSTDPSVTSKVLIGINVAVWLLITATGGPQSIWFYRLALRPKGLPVRLPDGSVLHGVADGAWWQLGSSMFTHVALLHIGFNMLALWVLGPQLEAVVGRARFLTIYLLSGLIGSAFVYWLSPPFTPTVGASGAIFGIMGALLVVAVKMRLDYRQILFWIGLNAIITIVGRGLISWQGHLGGLIGGAVIALVIVYSPRGHRAVWQAIGLGLVGLLLCGAVVARTLVLA